MPYFFTPPIGPANVMCLVDHAGSWPAPGSIIHNEQGHIDPPPPPPDDGNEWWDGGGGGGWGGPCSVDDVLFAYDSNAGSYAASKINRVNPGTYNLYEFDALTPSWDTNAWHIVNTGYDPLGYMQNPILMTGYIRPAGDVNWTIAVRMKAVTYNDFEIFPFMAGFYDITIVPSLYPPWNGYIEADHFNEDVIVYSGPDLNAYQWHVYALSARNLYVDGLLIASQIGVGTPTGYTDDSPYYSQILHLGGYLHKNFSAGDDYQQKSGADCDFNRVIGIDCEMNATEVAALSAAMAA